jgi:uncharacterized protein (DUF433 family)
MTFSRITVDADQMDGVPRIRGSRIPVATVVGMLAYGMSTTEILDAFPDLELDDVDSEASDRLSPLSVDVKLFDENAPGQMVVTAVPITSEVWPRAPDAHSLAILPRAPEALLAPVAQVLPRVRASKRHASPCGRVSTRVRP